MTEIEKICDEVAIIDKGKMIEHASVESLVTNKESDNVMIEVLYSDRLKELGLPLSGETTIKTTQEEICRVLEICQKHDIVLKQINFGSSNLEKHFLEMTSEEHV